MARYHVQSSGYLLFFSCALVGAIIFMFMNVIRPALNGSAPSSEHGGRLVIGSLFLMMFVLFFIMQLRVIRIIQLDTDGTIHLIRTLGRHINFSAQDVWEFKGG